MNQRDKSNLLTLLSFLLFMILNKWTTIWSIQRIAEDVINALPDDPEN